jgi:hypothetical protein
LKLRLKCFGMDDLVFRHQSARRESSDGTRCSIPALDSSLCHTSQVNTQEANR